MSWIDKHYWRWVRTLRLELLEAASSVLLYRAVSFQMSYKVEKIAGPHSLGEGPHWDEGRQALFYVDAFKSSVYRYLPQEDKLTVCKVGKKSSR